jgi:hypothetical protein
MLVLDRRGVRSLGRAIDLLAPTAAVPALRPAIDASAGLVATMRQAKDRWLAAKVAPPGASR